MLFKPGADDFDIKNRPIWRTNWVLEGLEARGAKVEGKSAKRSAGLLVARRARANTGGEGVGGGPF